MTETEDVTTEHVTPEEVTMDPVIDWTGSERLRIGWYQLRLAVQEMNYASRRLVEVQCAVTSAAPWR